MQDLLNTTMNYTDTLMGLALDRIAELERRIAVLETDTLVEDSMDTALILNVTQTARLLGISRTTVYKLIQSGALSARKFASSEDVEPRTVILTEDLKAYLAALPRDEGQPAS